MRGTMPRAWGMVNVHFLLYMLWCICVSEEEKPWVLEEKAHKATVSSKHDGGDSALFHRQLKYMAPVL